MNQDQNSNNDQASGGFQLLLQRELLRRCKETPGYSLRSFAKQLHIDATALSRILSGKRRLTRASIAHLAANLGLDPLEAEKFRQELSKKSRAVEEEIAVPNYVQITHDTFQAISNWYYLAILELTYIKGFQADERWVAQILGITKTEVNIAVQVLQRLGFLEIDAKGTWKDKYTNFSAIQPNFTNAGLKAFQEQILRKAMQALQDIPLELRDQTAITFAANTKSLKVAKEKITRFRRELTELMQSSPDLDAVYLLTVSLFPVSKPVLK